MKFLIYVSWKTCLVTYFVFRSLCLQCLWTRDIFQCNGYARCLHAILVFVLIIIAHLDAWANLDDAGSTSCSPCGVGMFTSTSGMACLIQSVLFWTKLSRHWFRYWTPRIGATLCTFCVAGTFFNTRGLDWVWLWRMQMVYLVTNTVQTHRIFFIYTIPESVWPLTAIG